MKITVVGGAGFIGRRLAEALATGGHEVTIFDKVPVEGPTHTRHVIGDVRNIGQLIETFREQDAIFNLAAEHRDDVHPRRLYDEVNVGGAKNVCVAADACGVKRIVFTSSVAVYGESRDPVSEKSAHRYTGDYGRTKSEAEEIYRTWFNETNDAMLVIVRPTVVFGPGNRGNVYNLISQISSRRFLFVGRGLNRKSIAYVDNVVDFLVGMVNVTGGLHVFNYSDIPDYTMTELVRLIKRILGMSASRDVHIPSWFGLAAGLGFDAVANATGRPLPVSKVRIEKFQANTQVDSTRARQAGFVPAVDLEEGLRRMVEAEFSTSRTTSAKA